GGPAFAWSWPRASKFAVPVGLPQKATAGKPEAATAGEGEPHALTWARGEDPRPKGRAEAYARCRRSAVVRPQAWQCLLERPRRSGPSHRCRSTHATESAGGAAGEYRVPSPCRALSSHPNASGDPQASIVQPPARNLRRICRIES